MKKIYVVALIVIASMAKQAKAQVVTTLAGNLGGGSADGTGAAASFNLTTGVAVDGSGNLYVADNLNNEIRKVVISTGVVTTLAGNLGVGSADGTGAAASFYHPQGIAVDGSGNLYVADTYNSEIRKIVIATGVVTTLCGSTTAGFANGTGAAASFYYPAGVCTDGSGNLYVADAGNNEIRKIVVATGVVTTLAGSYSVTGSADGTGASASFSNPAGVAADGSGNLYVADEYNNEIRKIVIATGVVTTLAGSLTSGSADGTGTAASFQNPTGVVADGSGNLYVADYNNNEIRKIVVATAVVTTLCGSTTAGSADGAGAAASFNAPFGVAADMSGNLYVADEQNNEIRKIDTCHAMPSVTYTLTADIAPHTWDAYAAYSPNVVSARWYWGDGTDTLALYPSHTYSVAGTYSICVAAYSACGDSAVSCQNDAVTRLGNNSPYSNMVYINVLNGSQTTGIAPLSFGVGQGVRLYPNPASTSLTLTLSKGEGTKATIHIYDMLGKLVTQHSYSPPSEGQGEAIDVSGLAEGIYNISISGNEGVVNKRLVIVR